MINNDKRYWWITRFFTRAWAAFFLSILLAAVVFYLSIDTFNFKVVPLQFATGDRDGTYRKFADALLQIVNKQEIDEFGKRLNKNYSFKIVAGKSAGAYDNIEKVYCGKADLGIVQGDTLTRFYSSLRHVQDVRVSTHLLSKKERAVQICYRQSQKLRNCFCDGVNFKDIRLDDKALQANGDFASESFDLTADPVADNIKVVAKLFPEYAHLIVKTGSDIKDFGDIRGRVIATAKRPSGTSLIFEDLARYYGLEFVEVKPEDIDHVRLKKNQVGFVTGQLSRNMERLLNNKKIVAAFMVIALHNHKLQDFLFENNHKVELVSFKYANAIARTLPGIQAAKLPWGVYGISASGPVPKSYTRTLKVASLLIVNKNVGNRQVHDLTQTLFERRSQIEAFVPQAKHISKPSKANDIHDGANSYYNRNDPLFINENADFFALILTISLLVCSVSWQLFLFMRDWRKNKADEHNETLARMITKIEDARYQEDLQDIRKEMFRVFQRVVYELDNDQIEEKSMLSFSFAWNVALETLHHHERILPKRSEL